MNREVPEPGTGVRSVVATFPGPFLTCFIYRSIRRIGQCQSADRPIVSLVNTWGTWSDRRRKSSA